MLPFVCVRMVEGPSWLAVGMEEGRCSLLGETFVEGGWRAGAEGMGAKVGAPTSMLLLIKAKLYCVGQAR